MTAQTPGQATRPSGFRDYTCGLCDEEFGSNCDPADIECTNCDARLCPCCGAWFSENGETTEPQTAKPTSSPGLPAAMATLAEELEREAESLRLTGVTRGNRTREETARRIREALAAREPQASPGVSVDVLKTLALAWREKADELDRDRVSAIAYRIAASDLDDAIAAAPEPHASRADAGTIKHVPTGATWITWNHRKQPPWEQVAEAVSRLTDGAVTVRAGRDEEEPDRLYVAVYRELPELEDE